MRNVTKEEADLAFKDVFYLEDGLELHFMPVDKKLKIKIYKIIYLLNEQNKVVEIIIRKQNGGVSLLSKEEGFEHAKETFKVLVEKEKMRLMNKGIDYEDLI